MKNKVSKILFLFLGFLLVVSCEDAIDIEQPGLIDEINAIETVSDVEGALLGAYDAIDPSYMIGLTSSLTDEVFQGVDNGGQNLNLQNFVVNSTDFYVTNHWRKSYLALNSLNNIIDKGSKIPGSAEYIAQAKALRAYVLFNLVTYFSTDYADNSALSAILITEPNNNTFLQLPRSTNGEFYTQIEKDLAEAENLISNTSKTFINKDFIIALKARMYTYREMYDKAEIYASQITEKYSLADKEQYKNMFKDEDDTEIIFKLERTVNDNYDGQGTSGGGTLGSLYAFVNAGIQGGPFMEMSRSVYNILQGSNDVRLETCLNVTESKPDPNYLTNSNFIQDDILLIYKYPGSESVNLMNDVKVFRASEFWLIRAEVAAANNQLVEAAEFLKELRDARFGNPTALLSFSNQEEAFGAILDERRLEFLFEGHRWIDLKRLGNRANRKIDRDPRECSFLTGCTLENSDYRFTLPIPTSEISANKNIVQNPGYE